MKRPPLILKLILAQARPRPPKEALKQGLDGSALRPRGALVY